MNYDALLERNRTHEQIKQSGAIGSLNDGIEITTHGVATRIIAWPGNGFEHQSVHVLTLKPGEESESYAYDMAEEAMVCLKGGGEVFLRGRWVDIQPGDVAYFPARVARGLRNPKASGRDFVLVNSIAPPELDLYTPAGYYDQAHGTMNFPLIEAAKRAARPGNLSPENELRRNESHPELRAWNLSTEEIRRDGALFNIYKGTVFSGLDCPMVLVLWPGYGVCGTGFHFGSMDPGVEAPLHLHPVADECVVQWAGSGISYIGDAQVPVGPLATVLAPCGVHHGGRVPADATERILPGGFAAPPQLDLYLKAGFCKNGRFERPPFENLQ